VRLSPAGSVDGLLFAGGKRERLWVGKQRRPLRERPIESVVLREEYCGHRAVGFGDDVEASASG
jgi:hypothetical protein